MSRRYHADVVKTAFCIACIGSGVPIIAAVVQLNRGCPISRSSASGRLRCLLPQLGAGEPGAVGQRLQLDPDDARVNLAGRGEACETAIGAGNYVLAPDRLREAADALGDQLGV